MFIRKRHIAAIVGLTFLTGCDGVAPSSEAIAVANKTEMTLLVVLAEAEVAGRLDPAPVLAVQPEDSRLVPSQGEKVFPAAEVMGSFLPNKSGLVVFIYNVQGEEATYAGHLSLTHQELSERRFRVVVEGLWPEDAQSSVLGSPERLLELTTRGQLTPQEQGLLDVIAQRPTSGSVAVAVAHRATRDLLTARVPVRFELAEGLEIVVTPDSVVDRGQNLSWSGPIGSMGAARIVNTGAGLTATIWIQEQLYRVEPLGSDRLHAVVRVDLHAFPPDHPIDADEITGMTSDANAIRTTTAYAGKQVHILVAYTGVARSQNGDIEGLVQLAVDEANASTRTATSTIPQFSWAPRR